jgi:hypothetical protein
MFHLEDVNFESRTNNRQGYHLVQGNNHMGFLFQRHFVFIKDFRAIKLGLILNDLNIPIEG